MSETSFEGIVEQGQIKLPPNIHWPDKARVQVVLADARQRTPTRIFSPRLAHPEQAKDFVLEVTEADPHA